MSKYYEVEVTVRVVLDDNTDEESAYEAVASFMSSAAQTVSTRDPLTWTMLDDCVTEVGP